MDARGSLEALVVSQPVRDTLREIAARCHSQSRGSRARDAHGTGIQALFCEGDGTGRLVAAKALASDLGRELHRVDLSALVSKYIGETEKNLRQVFAAAEERGAVLLFDEADGLFGSRTEVRDAHDRYANLEVTGLLQRIEAYSGLAIITSNRKADLDAAFLRRLRYVVEFS